MADVDPMVALREAERKQRDAEYEAQLAQDREDPFAARMRQPSTMVEAAGYGAPTKAAFVPIGVPTTGVRLTGAGDLLPGAASQEQQRQAAAAARSVAASARGGGAAVGAAQHARQFGSEAGIGSAQQAGLLAQAQGREQLRRQMALGQAELAAMAARRGMVGQEFGYNMGEREAIQQMLADRQFAQYGMRGELGRGLSAFATGEQARNYQNAAQGAYGAARSDLAAQQRQRQMAAAIGTAGGTALGAAVGGPVGAMAGGAIGNFLGTATSDWW